MREYSTEAIVLDREPAGDSDLRVSLLTKKFGKVTGKVKSGRKITSKLSGHLQPAFLVLARFIEKGGAQIVDAIKIGRVKIGIGDLRRFGKIIGEREADMELWRALLAGGILWEKALGHLGWDPRDASCSECRKGSPAVFFINSQEFFCKNCVSGFREEDVIYIGRQEAVLGDFSAKREKSGIYEG